MTQSVISTLPMIAPKVSLCLKGLPVISLMNSNPSSRDSVDLDACTKSLPLKLVDQLRFSIILSPRTTASAKGWRMLI